MPRIVLVGGYGHRDIGDESMLTMVLIKFRELFPDAQFIALSDNPAYTAQYHQVDSEYSINHYLFESRGLGALAIKCLAVVNLPMKLFNLISRLLYSDVRMTYSQLPGRTKVLLRGGWLLFNAKRLTRGAKPILLNEDGEHFLKILEGGDILFNVGGGNLNSLYLLGGLYGKCLTYLACKILGKPVILSGQTVGPIENWFDRLFAGYVLDKVDLITLRDVETSRKLLAEIGVTRPIMKDTVDDAFLLPAIPSEQIGNILQQEGVNSQRPLVGINIQDNAPNWHRMRRRVNPMLANIADYLVTEKGAQIVFVPMQYVRAADDRRAAAEVRSFMKHQNHARIIQGEYDDKTLKGIIGELDMAIGTRYHFTLFALVMRVPTISLCLNSYYSQKNGGAMKMMGQEKFLHDLEIGGVEHLKRSVDEVWACRMEIRRELGERVSERKELSRFAICYAADLLAAQGG